MSLPVLALHGQPGAGWVFAPMAQRLRAEGIETDRPDRPGYGAGGPAALGVAANAEWLLERIVAGPGERAVVVAHSWAALPALLAASRAPDAVAALVLLSPAGPTAVTGTDRVIARRGLGPVLTWPLAVPASGRMGWLARPWLRAAVPAPDRAVARDTLRRTATRGVQRSFLVEQRAMIAEMKLVSAAVGRIAVPVTVVIGTADALIAPRSMLQLARSLPQSRVVLLHGAGHSVQLHRPAEVAAVVREAVRSAPD